VALHAANTPHSGQAQPFRCRCRTPEENENENGNGNGEGEGGGNWTLLDGYAAGKFNYLLCQIQHAPAQPSH
jgi:hypothetical protein